MSRPSRVTVDQILSCNLKILSLRNDSLKTKLGLLHAHIKDFLYPELRVYFQRTTNKMLAI